MTPLQRAVQQALGTLESGALLCEVTAASMLRVALEAEQAQAVEPVNTNIERIAGAISRHISTPLLQREVLAAAQYIVHRYIPTPAEPTVTQPLSTERAGLINTPEKVRKFFSSNFDALHYGRDDQAPDEDDKYTMSAHDIISAFDWSADMLEAAAQPKAFICQRAQLDQEWCDLRKLKQAQQAAVPAGCLAFKEQDMIDHLKPSAIKTIKAADLAIRYAKRNAPQGDKT